MKILSARAIASLFVPQVRIISFRPTKKEVRPFVVFPELKALLSYLIEPDATLDPSHEATACRKFISGNPGILFIPGAHFDTTGTRHGKGFGWYDRFLSMVPKEWVRIGFCFDDQFHTEPLIRESWDEPVDFVCVVTKETSTTLFYETHARLLKHL